MILNNSNWQPAIVRSVRGNSSYGFVNQVFEADVDKLKVEIALATKPNQINNQFQVLPCTLTVSYLENIDDDVFSIPLGLTKPLATLVEGLKPYSFRLKLDNPNVTAVTGTVKKPKIKRVTIPNIQPVSIINNPQQSDPALLAALTAGAAATAALAASMAAQPGLIADAIANNAMTIDWVENTVVNQAVTSLLPIDQTRQYVTVSNWSTNRVKMFCSSNTISGGTYNSVMTEHVLEPAVTIAGELRIGGVVTFENAECKGNVYAISNGAPSSRGVHIKVARTTP